jgi:alkylhydroperoxidase/carboxymuconolactone decarboxylase family protein YurZ
VFAGSSGIHEGGSYMKRQEVLEQITKTLGAVPDWLGNLPDVQLENTWGLTAWFLGDSKLSARDKALVAFGAATATRCPY